jgi:hypothetical protein
MLTAISAVAAIAAAAGCGTVNAGTPVAAQTTAPPAIPATLCAAAGYVGSLTIARVDEFPSNHLRFTFPPRVTTTAPEAQDVAKAVCGLPRMPRTMFSCPMDWGVSYRLTFGAGAKPGVITRRFPPVTVDATGCQTVSGAGPQRWLATTPGFWKVLGTAADVADPSSAFAGCRNQSGMTCPVNATYNS